MGSSHEPVMQELEAALRVVGKRVYSASSRESSTRGQHVDRSGYAVLVVLDERGEIRLSELATLLELDLSTVSRQVRQLEDVGLLRRRPDPDDGRASLLNLSPEGRRVLTRVRTSRVELLATALHDWDADDCAALVRLLQRLTDDLAPAANRPPTRTTVKGTA